MSEAYMPPIDIDEKLQEAKDDGWEDFLNRYDHDTDCYTCGKRARWSETTPRCGHCRTCWDKKRAERKRHDSVKG